MLRCSYWIMIVFSNLNERPWFNDMHHLLRHYFFYLSLLFSLPVLSTSLRFAIMISIYLSTVHVLFSEYQLLVNLNLSDMNWDQQISPFHIVFFLWVFYSSVFPKFLFPILSPVLDSTDHASSRCSFRAF